MKALPFVLNRSSRLYAQSPTCSTESYTPAAASATSVSMHTSFASPKSPKTACTSEGKRAGMGVTSKTGEPGPTA